MSRHATPITIMFTYSMFIWHWESFRNGCVTVTTWNLSFCAKSFSKTARWRHLEANINGSTLFSSLLLSMPEPQWEMLGRIPPPLILLAGDVTSVRDVTPRSKPHTPTSAAWVGKTLRRERNNRICWHVALTLRKRTDCWDAHIFWRLGRGLRRGKGRRGHSGWRRLLVEVIVVLEEEEMAVMLS